MNCGIPMQLNAVFTVASVVEHTFLEKAKTVGVDSFWYKDAKQGKLLSVMDQTMAGERIFPDKTPEVKLGLTTSYELTRSELEMKQFPDFSGAVFVLNSKNYYLY